MISDEHVLVIGGQGFLGNAITNSLRQEGREVTQFDLPTNSIVWPDPWNRGAVGGQDVLDGFVGNADIVIHTAAVADMNIARQNAEQAKRVNVEGSLNVQAACQRSSVPLVFISTCCVYGNQPISAVVTEETQPAPVGLYAETKYEAELRLLDRGDGAGGDLWICRLATFYGPGMRKSLFNYTVLDCCWKGSAIQIHGNGQQTRQYLHVDDVVSGIICAYRSGEPGIYNVSGNLAVSVLDSVSIAEQLSESRAALTWGPDRVDQIHAERAISAKLRALGWEQKIAYDDGMARTFEWLVNTQTAARGPSSESLPQPVPAVPEQADSRDTLRD